MVYLGIFHPLLPTLITKERKHVIERAIRIVHDIGERSTLAIIKKLFLRNGESRHSCVLAIVDIHQDTISEGAFIVPAFVGHTKAWDTRALAKVLDNREHHGEASASTLVNQPIPPDRNE